jgi:hypothetical protein
MTITRIIEVPVPTDANATSEELDLLESAFQAIVELRFPRGREWERVQRALAAEGWTAQVRLMWVADARRGHEQEMAVGRTLDEAFVQLQEQTRMDRYSQVS